MTPIYGIAGEKFSGKDTIADAIIARFARHGTKAKKVPFAEPLKQAVCAMFGWERKQLEDHIFKETPEPITGKTPRYIMQAMGTEFARELLHDDVWIRLAAAEVQRCVDADIVPILTDVRFTNESDFVRSVNGKLIHVINPETVTRTDAHASENGVPKLVGDASFVNEKSRGMVPVYEFVEKLITFKGK